MNRNRRKLLLATVSIGIGGNLLTKSIFGAPCPPPVLDLDSSDSASTACIGASATTPAWLATTPLMTWVQIPNTQLSSAQSSVVNPGGSKQFVTSYSGATIKSSGSEIFLAGGGHADYAGNEVYTLKLSDNAPVWARRNDPSQSVGSTSVPGNAYNGDGTPAARHTYYDLWFIDARDKLFFITANAVWGNGNGSCWHCGCLQSDYQLL